MQTTSGRSPLNTFRWSQLSRHGEASSVTSPPSCVTAAENYRLQKIEKTTPGPEKYAIAGVEFTSQQLPWLTVAT
jgi:hypothetical protein